MFKSYYYKKNGNFTFYSLALAQAMCHFVFQCFFFSPLTPRIKTRRNEYLLPCPALLTVFSSFKWLASKCVLTANIL